MPARRHRHRATPLVALLVCSSLLLVACGDDENGAGGGKKGARASVPRSPLTGQVLQGKPPTHPVLAVKIDNSASSSPQAGLGSADLVAEELVEGGITRLAVFFYSEVPETVGPVRSMRATDIGIVRPLDAVLVASGGAPPTVARVADAGIETFTEGAPGYFRDESGVAPYNLFMRLRDLARTLDDSGPTASYVQFGSGDALPKGESASGLTATFSGSSSSTFALEKGRYVNTDTFAAADDQFRADTVLVLRVEVGDAGYKDPAGNPVPETIFEGKGEAMIFHGGRVVRGTWSKTSLSSDLNLRADGKTLSLPTGKTWIELVPVDGGSVSVTR